MDTQRGLYLSPKTDWDLINLYYQIGAKGFAKALKESLRKLIRPGYESKYLDSLKPNPVDVAEYDKPIKVSLSFNSVKDADIRGLLGSCRQGHMTALMKQALRYGIGPYFTMGCYLNGDEKICKAFVDKEMFFIVSKTPLYAPVPVAPKQEKPIKAKPVEIPTVPAYVPEEPIVTVPTEGNSTFDDDDILDALDNL